MENPADDSVDKERQEPTQDEKPAKDKFLIVGIGASAGGIRALQEFFNQVQENSGMAYVAILHLSPNHDSKLAEVLRTAAKIPVSQVTEKVMIQPDHVYVVPPNQHLKMDDGYITVSPNTLMEERRAPIDIFFRTLADNHGSRAVCVVLSGTGANGSMGLKRIKERGGATFAQNPREAEFNEMPRNAISTEMVDEVLSVADIPSKIIAYRNNLGLIRILDDAKNHSQDEQAYLRDIFNLLRARTGHDFSNYKRPTLIRRIERRINICGLPDLPAYVAYLQQHTEEAAALLKDLLISVTNFFRDRKAFEVIEQEVIPLLLRGKTGADQLRIWVAGCATGEEAYSFAMLCTEKMVDIDAPALQIFATDIDEASIAHARDGLYTLNDAADVSPERLHRFFKREGDGYRIRREIRETIMFAQHNFLKDPPFSHVDLVSCRNVLIYLNQVAQERVTETFHFALNPGGYLFLGSSESVNGASDLYAVYNRDSHIFQSRQVSQRMYPMPDPSPVHQADKPKVLLNTQEHENRVLERISYGDLHQRLLEQYAPPSLVVNEEYDIVHLTGRAGRYLQINGGELSRNLLKLVRPELRLELRSALYQSVQRQSPTETRGLKLRIDDNSTETINIHVRPVLRAGDTARGFILVLFEQTNEENKQEILLTSDEPVAIHLEEELLRLKTQLRATNEQHEFQSEELKASNEELQAMNEELRSAAEELETSKEELQSINEELRTVNQELKVKIEETSRSTNNLQNLINSSDIGTIFLDRSFRVVLFTPAARAIFNLIPADYGRTLSDITSRLDYENLLTDAETVLEKLSVAEREVGTKDGKIYLMRITPYRTDEDRIKGVVIAFIDITHNKAAEKALRAVNERMRLIVESAKDYAIFTLDLQRRVNSWNKGAQAMFGFTEEEITGQFGDILFVPEDREDGALQYETGKAQTEGRGEYERWHIRKNGERFYGSGVVTLLHDSDGNIIGFVKIMRDLTGQKQAEDALRVSEERMRLAMEAANMLSWEMNVGTGETRVSENYAGVTGFAAELLPANWIESITRFLPAEDAAIFIAAIEKTIRGEGDLHCAYRMMHPGSGLVVWIEAYAVLIAGKDKNSARVVGIAQNITERRQADKALRESEERLRITMESVTDYAIITTDVNGLIQGWNSGAERIFDYTAEEVTGKPGDIIFMPQDIEDRIPAKEMQLAREQGYANDERWHLRKDGSAFFMSAIIRPILNSGVTGFVKVARNITEQKQADEHLRISEERYRIALQSSEMAAWDWYIADKNVVWNEQYYRMLGLPLRNASKGSEYFIRFVHPDDKARISKALVRAVKTTGILHEEFRILHAENRTQKWMSIYGRVVAKEGKRALRMVGVMYDVTERRQLEQQKEEFIGIASHELKTPVTSIKAYGELLEEMFEAVQDTQSASLIQKLNAQVNRLNSLISDLLDTTKIFEGHLLMNFERFNLVDLVRERVEELGHLSQKHHLVFRVVDPVIIAADKERIGQVLNNLISNAVKYSPQGGEVAITCELLEQEVKVGVADQGIGIPGDVADKVFNRFFRVRHGKANLFPGMGLGLYITAGIIHRHGGSIGVKSELGRGSFFYFTLPYGARGKTDAHEKHNHSGR